MKESNPQCILHTAKIEQLLEDVQEIKAEIRAEKSDAKSERKELWAALTALRESITGNHKEGFNVKVDRNTRFRRNLSRLLWALFTPLYGGMMVLLVKIFYDTFTK